MRSSKPKKLHLYACLGNAISCSGCFAPARSPGADTGSGFPGDFTAFTKPPLRGGAELECKCHVVDYHTHSEWAESGIDGGR